MIVIKLSGGLGNQMFQYCFGYALSKKTNISVKYDLSFYEKKNIHDGILINNVFNLKLHISQKDELKKYLGLYRFNLFRNLKKKLNIKSSNYVIENANQEMIAFNKELDNSYMDGYWQNWNYFDEYKDDLNKLFTFKNINCYKFEKLKCLITEKNSAIIHIRRGDYIDRTNQNIFYQLNLSYFYEGMNLIKQRCKDVIFYVFSDDIDFAKIFFNYDNNIVFIDLNRGSDSFKDMYLMSLSKNIIISNSTFSWWSAWLGSEKKKNIIAPKLWFKQKKNAHQYYMPNWHII